MAEHPCILGLEARRVLAFVKEATDMNCANCPFLKWKGSRYVCYGQKGAPYWSPKGGCIFD